MAMTSVHNSSDLAPQRKIVSTENNTSGPVPQCSVKTFDRSRSSLGLHGNDNIKVNSFTMKMEILLEPASNKLLVAFKIRHNMRMLVKDTRSQDGKDDKDNDKGSKSRSQSMKEQAYNKEQRERPRPHELNDESNLIDLMKECLQ
ncbi:hypothetical protein Tco_0808935 [Tanacetum coccineum]